jgi:hypothetical protein
LSADAPDYLRAVDAIHAEPLEQAKRDSWSADAFFAVQEEMYERHMRELRLTIEHRGQGIARTKVDDLVGLWARVHQPVRQDVDTFFDGRESVALQDLPPADLSEADAWHLAAFMNARAGETLKEVIAILGPADFETFYGHAPDVPFLLVEPDILKGASAASRNRKS